MRALLLLLVTVLAVSPALAAPAAGGNWATVTLDEPPDGVVVGRPWRFGFTVKQHDVTPRGDVTPRLAAVHRRSAATVDAVGSQEGAEGHFVIEVTFPEAGEWQWSITPEPFPEFTFDPLSVAAEAEAAATSGASPPLNLGRRGHEVTINDSTFSPASLTVQRGEAVVWRNEDAVAHTVVGDDRSFANSGLLQKGELFVQIFDRPGVYTYHCGPHAEMTGTVTVR